MKRTIFSVIGLLVIAFLAACSDESQGVEKKEAEDIKELVNDYSAGDIPKEVASITSDHLIVTKEDESQFSYDLPEDEFFVSVAPYVHETHP